jgi:hypothetical protein
MTGKKIHSKQAKDRHFLSLEGFMGDFGRLAHKADKKLGIDFASPPPVRKSSEYGPDSRYAPTTTVTNLQTADNQISYQDKIKKMQADLEKEREEEERRMRNRRKNMSAGGRTKKSKARGCGAARQQMFTKNG